MNFKKAISAALSSLLLLASIPSYAAPAASEKIPYDTFETYGSKLGGGWRVQGADTTAPIVETEKGKSVMGVTSPGGMLEIFRDFAQTGENVTSVACVFSIKIADQNSQRSFYTRTSSGEYAVLAIQKGGKIKVGKTEYTEMLVEIDKWYNFFVEYNAKSGYTRCHISDGSETVTVCSNQDAVNLTGLYRMNFALFKPDEGESVTYIDNAAFYELPYDVEAYADGKDTNAPETFDDFEPAADGLTAPQPGWRLQNIEAGKTSLTAESAEGRGKYLKMHSEGFNHFELVKDTGLLEGEAEISFDFMKTPQSYFKFGLRGTRPDGSHMNGAFPIELTKSGMLNISDEALTALSDNVWYKLKNEFNTESNTMKITVLEGDTEAASKTIPIPQNLINITAYEFYMTVTGNASTVCFDNCFAGKNVPKEAGVSGISPAFGNVSKNIDKITVSFDEKITDENLENAEALINGSAENIKEIKAEGKTAVITLSHELAENMGYLFELTGVKIGEKELSAIMFYQTRPAFEVISVEGGELKPGLFSFTAKMAATDGGPEKATLITIIYDNKTNAMVGADFCTADLTPDGTEFNTSVALPEGSYRAVNYIWDNVKKMRSLNAFYEIK